MVYLDYNASTPVDPRVVELVSSVLAKSYGNPSSSLHQAGSYAMGLVEEARTQLAELLNVSNQSVIFTSGATEAINTAILGLALSCSRSRRNFVVSAIEHKAVFASAELAARISGGEVRVVRVDDQGIVDLNHLGELIDDSVVAVAIMLANNEVGVINRASVVGPVVHRYGALLLSDTTQAIGKLLLSGEMGHIDLAVLSGHKFYGPKGVGALVVDRHIQKQLTSLVAGGGQERGLRGGTENVPGVAGLGLAAQLVAQESEQEIAVTGNRADQLFEGLEREFTKAGLPCPKLNAHGAERLGNTLNFQIPGLDAEAVIASAPNLELSTGSACQSAVTTPSHVLTAIGLSAREAEECLRISIGRFTSPEDVNQAVIELTAACVRVKELSASGGAHHGT